MTLHSANKKRKRAQRKPVYRGIFARTRHARIAVDAGITYADLMYLYGGY